MSKMPILSLRSAWRVRWRRVPRRPRVSHGDRIADNCRFMYFVHRRLWLYFEVPRRTAYGAPAALLKGRSPRRQPPEVVGRMVLSGAPPSDDSQRLSLCTDTTFVELERDTCVGDVSWLSHSLTGETKKIVGEDVVLDSDGGMAFVTIHR